MKRTLLAALIAAGAVVATPSFALTQADRIGQAASDHGLRTIKVTPDTRKINVDYNETVTFDVAGQTQSWTFNGTEQAISLRQIVPGAPDVPVYVTPDRFTPPSGSGA
jgi:Heavy-metal resistance protein CzcE